MRRTTGGSAKEAERRESAREARKVREAPKKIKVRFGICIRIRIMTGRIG